MFRYHLQSSHSGLRENKSTAEARRQDDDNNNCGVQLNRGQHCSSWNIGLSFPYKLPAITLASVELSPDSSQALLSQWDATIHRPQAGNYHANSTVRRLGNVSCILQEKENLEWRNREKLRWTYSVKISSFLWLHFIRHGPAGKERKTGDWTGVSCVKGNGRGGKC